LSVDKYVLFDIKEEKRYRDLKGKAIDHSIWRAGFRRRRIREKCKEYVEGKA
jgi:hypothetical protein